MAVGVGVEVGVAIGVAVAVGIGALVGVAVAGGTPDSIEASSAANLATVVCNATTVASRFPPRVLHADRDPKHRMKRSMETKFFTYRSETPYSILSIPQISRGGCPELVIYDTQAR
ncbi:MAG: hypothetical protein A2Y60_05935 [Chloroflexi bacterium RBG_13_54_9]|nr:MAG: hypothetical protein A2Y60_05935 [Chloroflexi bacterium RBG_13_54_9]